MEAIKASLKLTQQQRDVLVGLLLGDGHIERPYRTPRARLKVEQSEKSQEYVEWLYAIFREWIPGGIKKKSTFLPVTGKTYVKHYFTTYVHEAFLPYRSLFYCGKRKIVPRNIHELMTPVGVATWFMDDGSIKSHQSRGSIISTHAFTEKEIRLLCAMLKKKFHLESWPRIQRDGVQIYISGTSAETLQKLLEPYVIPCMGYKLPLRIRVNNSA